MGFVKRVELAWTPSQWGIDADVAGTERLPVVTPEYVGGRNVDGLGGERHPLRLVR